MPMWKRRKITTFVQDARDASMPLTYLTAHTKHKAQTRVQYKHRTQRSTDATHPNWCSTSTQHKHIQQKETRASRMSFMVSVEYFI
jgi:hypothetical protein